MAYSVYRINDEGGTTWMNSEVLASSPSDAVRKEYEGGRIGVGQTIFAVDPHANPNGKRCLFRVEAPPRPAISVVPVGLDGRRV